MSIFVGCAGWSLGRFTLEFPGNGTHLQRYATRFHTVEINSSFYRPHLPKTYERWAASTPDDFRFAVKMPKRITHECRLVGSDEYLARFLNEVSGLGEKLGPLLVQLPPSLKYDALTAESFFSQLRSQIATPIVCEPRHASWFSPQVTQLFERCRISRVAADPAPIPAAASPGGSQRLVYFRLHGSPRMYYSSYDATQLAELAKKLLELPDSATDVWCIFDNTAQGAAIQNALEVVNALSSHARSLTASLQFGSRFKSL